MNQEPPTREVTPPPLPATTVQRPVELNVIVVLWMLVGSLFVMGALFDIFYLFIFQGLIESGRLDEIGEETQDLLIWSFIAGFLINLFIGSGLLYLSYKVIRLSRRARSVMEVIAWVGVVLFGVVLPGVALMFYLGEASGKESAEAIQYIAMAAICALFFFGTLLNAATIYVLRRPNVREAMQG